MKTKEFFDLAQASSYLRHSIIRLGADPIYVHDVVEGEGRRKNGYMLTYQHLKSVNARIKTIALKDDAIDMNPVPLGMVPYFNGERWETYYTGRIPTRKWKIGLTRDNFHAGSVFGGDHSRATAEKLFPKVHLHQTIVGDYPDLDEIKTQFDLYGGLIPFSRRFCIDHYNHVYHKLTEDYVATYDRGKGKMVMKENYSYLTEVLAEDARC